MDLGIEFEKMSQIFVKAAGMTMILRRTIFDSYDVSTGLVTDSGTHDEYVNAVLLNYNDKNLDGSVIKTGDRKIIVGPTNASGSILEKEPQLGDSFILSGSTVDDKELVIVNVRISHCYGVVTNYICQVRENG